MAALAQPVKEALELAREALCLCDYNPQKYDVLLAVLRLSVWRKRRSTGPVTVEHISEASFHHPMGPDPDVLEDLKSLAFFGIVKIEASGTGLIVVTPTIKDWGKI
jgi:hypothetical protein